MRSKNNRKTKKIYRYNKNKKGGASLSDNLNKLGSVLGQTGQNLFDWSINEFSEYTGVDPNKSAEQVLAEATSRVQNINNVLKSPQGQRLMNEVNELSSDIGENIIAPATEKIAETAIRRSGELGKQAVKTGLDIAGMVPVFGEVVEGVRTVSDLVRTGEKMVEAGSEVAGITADATKELAKKKEQASGLITQFTQLMNSGIEKGINVAEQLNKNVSDKLIEQQKELQPNNIQMGGSSFDEIQNGGRIVAKRAMKSQDEFLRSRFTRKKIMKNYKKK
jgi:hypothetical protein